MTGALSAMFMAMVMLAPLGLLAGVGGWMAAVAMLKKGRNPRRAVIVLAIVLAIAVSGLFAFDCLASGACSAPAGHEDLAMRAAMIVAYAGLPLVPLAGGFAAGMAGGWLFAAITKRRAG